MKNKTKSQINPLAEIDALAWKLVAELIAEGWDFDLCFDRFSVYRLSKKIEWECDFTRRKKNGLYDNHEPGIADTASKAIEIAYKNIRAGKRLKK